MSKIISIIIKFLNSINKFIWKIIIFLSKFIKIDEINHLHNKPDDVKYRLFNVDDPAIIEPFVKIEHKDWKQLVKDNNIKPIKRRNNKYISIDVKCPCCGAPKDYLYDNTGKGNQFECKVVLLSFLLILTKRKMLFLNVLIVNINLIFIIIVTILMFIVVKMIIVLFTLKIKTL